MQACGRSSEDSTSVEEWLVQAIQALCENSTSAVLLSSQLREFSQTKCKQMGTDLKYD